MLVNCARSFFALGRNGGSILIRLNITFQPQMCLYPSRSSFVHFVNRMTRYRESTFALLLTLPSSYLGGEKPPH
nr:hypothetical protein Q903MT_gene614 [Picea sitchensis]